MVFQDFNLFPHRTALENVCEGPLTVLGKPRTGGRRRSARELLEMVGLPDKASHYPIQLSGGQQQRVAIARALAMNPKVMLFDEPTSALDPELIGEVLAVMRRLSTELGITMLVVTHEMGFAREVASRMVFVHEGSIIEQGPAAQVLERPEASRNADVPRGSALTDGPMRTSRVGARAVFYVSGTTQAEVAELVDAPDSKSGARKGVGVRFPPSALRPAVSIGRGPRASRSPRALLAGLAVAGLAAVATGCGGSQASACAQVEYAGAGDPDLVARLGPAAPGRSFATSRSRSTTRSGRSCRSAGFRREPHDRLPGV